MKKYVLITGASSGIGKSYAKMYAQKGNNLIIVARSEDKLKQLARELELKYKVNIEIIVMDLSLEYAGKILYEEIEKRHLNVNVLVNNAGFATKGLFNKIDFDQQHKEILLNMATLTELTYLILGDMCEKKQGTIINIASAASFNPLPYSAVYAATKAYVLSLTESLSYEYKKYGIRVLAVCPGATDTHFFDNFGAVTNNLRRPEDVVNTTFHALENENKIICTDGMFCKLQVLLHRISTRKHALKFMGKAGEKTWGGK
ncbi:SDR family NAD(P)-dependent oxidoreductase [Anaerotignum sp.]|uniref:SDR family NAD(P)-dependent oxidoreductase n=1 Tax=Anaerotignum sp. TaxID=2039241 RepID=UPI00289832F5|nr:SDR family oxidoreductase [Anaerotignum sp.]